MKKGITMLSLVIYVVLFFAFSAIAISVSTNMNFRTLSEKGIIYCNEELQKLQYNLLNSAKNSTSCDIIQNTFVFSNGDEYVFDSSNKKIYKNGGTLIDSISSCSSISVSELKSTPENFVSNIDKDAEYVCLNVEFSKYNQILNTDLFFKIGDDTVE